MMIAFKVFDPEDEECITAEEVKYVMRNIPINFEERYGVSFGYYDQEANIGRN